MLKVLTLSALDEGCPVPKIERHYPYPYVIHSSLRGKTQQPTVELNLAGLFISWRDRSISLKTGRQ